MSSVSLTILTLSAQVSFLIVVVWLLEKLLLHNKPKASAKLLSLSMILFLGLGIAALLPLPSWMQGTDRPQDDRIEVANVVEAMPATPQPASGVELTSGSGERGELVSAAPLGWQDQIAVFANELRRSPAELSNELNLLTAIQQYLAVAVTLFVLLGLFRFALGAHALWRLKSTSVPVECDEILARVGEISTQLGCHKKIEVSRSSLLATAATVGWRSPQIFVADDFQDLDTATQDSILAHEIAHIQHGDFFANVVSQVCTSIYFFNPLVHWLVRSMRLHQEIAADRAAAAITVGADKYSKMLAALAIRQDSEKRSPKLASTFLMPENSFVRRIKMLNTNTTEVSPRSRILLHSCLLIAAVAICGMRVPAVDLPADPASESVVANQQSDDKKILPFTTDYLGNRPDQVAVFVRPADILDSSLATKVLEIGPFKGAVRGIEKNFESSTGVGASHIEQYIVVTSFAENEEVDRSWSIAKTFEDNLDNFKSLGEVVGNGKSFPITLKRDEPGAKYGLIVDEKTIVWAFTEKAIENVKKINKRAAQRAAWYSPFSKVAKRHLVFVGNGELMKTFGKDMLSKRQLEKLATCDTLVASASAGAAVNYSVEMAYASTSDAKTAEKAVGKVVKAWQRLLAAASNSADVLTKSMGMSAMESLDELDVSNSGKTVSLKSTFEIDIKTLDAASDVIRSAARRTQGMNNQRQLALAMMNYEAAYGHFPKSIVTHESGQKHSWRIAILPFLQQKELYDRYRLDEPWDSPHNKEVTKEMPECFKHPESDSKTDTNYFVVVGEQTLFNGRENSFSNISDGSSNTVLIVEAIRDCHWAKPVDILFEEASLVETLGGFDKDTFAVTTADGAVKQMQNSISPKIFQAMLTISGGEVLSSENPDSIE